MNAELVIRFALAGAGIGWLAGNWQKGAIIGAAVGAADSLLRGGQA